MSVSSTVRTDEAAVEELTAKGMEEDEVSDYEEWKTALAPVWDYFKSAIRR